MLILEKSPMELKSIIGKRVTEEGQLVRMNKIALAQMKYILSSKEINPEMRNYLMKSYFMGNYVNESLAKNAELQHLTYGNIKLSGINLRIRVDGYKTDGLRGLCEDGDVNCVRLVKNTDDGDKVIKKKVGKVVAEALANVGTLCPQAKTFIAEDVARKWKAYASEHSPNANLYHLVVNDDFDAIYDRYKQVGDFHSCMNGCEGIEFYSTVQAKAASLRDEDGMIVARCVVFTEVYDLNGNVYRYAERQYSTDQNLTLQQILVNKLYAEGYIDLHKRVGASCHDSDDVVDINGNKFYKELYIEAHLSSGDYCPYMDGFAYYDEGDRRAYNMDGSCRIELHETDGYYGSDDSICEVCGRRMDEADCCWSEYHNMNLCADCAVWSYALDTYLRADCAVDVLDCNGNHDDWMPDDWDNHRHEIVEIEGEWHWLEDCCFDEINEEEILCDNAVDYQYLSYGSWCSAYTHKDEIDNSIVEFEDEYYLMDDCTKVDGVWYPCDQVPEDDEEEVEEEVNENVEC